MSIIDKILIIGALALPVFVFIGWGLLRLSADTEAVKEDAGEYDNER